MFEAGTRGHEKHGDITVDERNQLVLVTSFGTFKLKVSEDTPVSERQFKGILDLLNRRRPL